MTLDDLLTDETAELPDVAVASSTGGGRTWSRRGRTFAGVSADGSVAEFALDPAVAAAAIRTPDTAASTQGRGWVSFAPAALDDHAADRAVAWFASAYRRAGPQD